MPLGSFEQFHSARLQVYCPAPPDLECACGKAEEVDRIDKDTLLHGIKKYKARFLIDDIGARSIVRDNGTEFVRGPREAESHSAVLSAEGGNDWHHLDDRWRCFLARRDVCGSVGIMHTLDAPASYN